MNSRYRTLAHDGRYDEECRSLGDVQRMDEALRFLHQRLAEHPEQGRQLRAGSAVWAAVTQYTRPTFIIYYTFDADSVTLLSIRSR